ncbi:MAG: hypothetical protein LBH42_02530 [Treponema sp.]|jgi:uncharacterized protein (TIGR03545 family)|nr:hypothetical protein [Treponema sp.]
MKEKKIKKAPCFYKKQISTEKLEKKYLKYIEVPVDKSFLSSCYEKRDETLFIRTDLDETEVKRLKELKSAIKKNRKFAVNILPLGVCAAIIAGLVFFFTVLANPLLQKALETGLEAVFEAKVNADRFRISFLKFEIAMNGLTIADRDHPMQNLIQFSKMRIKLKPEAVLRGKVYIEEIRADSIRFGTDRTVSGALPNKPPKDKKPRESTEIPPLVDLQNFDPMALLNQEFDKLRTPKLYDTAIEAYDTTLAKWKGEQQAAMARLAELQARAEPLLRINANDFRTLDANTIAQIRTLVEEINALTSTVQSAQGDVNRMVSGAQDDINMVRALEQSARDAITADFNHLRSFLNPGSGMIAEVLEGIIRSILTDTAETYLAYGERALELLEQVQTLQAKIPRYAPKPPKAEKFKGRDVVFPTRQYPKFFLGILATDVLTPSAWLWGLDLRSISSDPDLSNLPTTLALALTETGDGLSRNAAFNGQADFRSGARERFNAELSGGGFPVDVSAKLQQIGIGGFSGGASFKLNANGSTDGSFATGGDISLREASLKNPANTFAQAADEAIRHVRSVDLGVRYEHITTGKDHFSVSTNFGDILKDSLARIVTQYLRQAEEALERALRAKIEQYIDGKFISKEDLDTVFRLLRGDLSAADDLKNTLDRKKAELENRIRATVDDVTDQARQQTQQAAQDLLHGQTPSAPSLPTIQNPLRR